MAKTFEVGDCVLVPDGRIGRVRKVVGKQYRVRVRRTTSATHQFLMFSGGDLKRVDCPKGWMSPKGYARYLKVTLAKMQQPPGPIEEMKVNSQRRADSLPQTILTIGHSSRSLEEFVELLQAHSVTLIVDVRKMPGSRRNPQFGCDAIQQVLQRVCIGYVHLPGLGGLRRRTPDSPNTGWKNASFQGYADYMLTPEFENSLQELLQLPSASAALMCAEAVPWRCHRSLIADALVAHGVAVEHILSKSRTQAHVLRPWAHVEGIRITYPPTTDAGDPESP